MADFRRFGGLDQAGRSQRPGQHDRRPAPQVGDGAVDGLQDGRV